MKIVVGHGAADVAMRKGGWLLLASSCLVAGCAVQPAGAPSASGPAIPDTVLLLPPGDVETACHSLWQVGVKCIYPNETWKPSDAGPGQLPMSFADYSLLDRGQGVRVSGLLLLTEEKSPEGNRYYAATSRVYKFGFMGVRAAIEADSYGRAFWRVVAAKINIAPVGSPAAERFVDILDKRLAEARRAEEERAVAQAADRKKQAEEAAYRASPEYKRSQAAARVAACKNQIALARAAIARDERVAQISGYENKLVRESAAQSIVNCQDRIARGGY